MDIYDRMLDLSQEGYSCAQILMIIALETDEKEDPDLIRSMTGLAGGLGYSGNLCGALVGGVCFLSYFSGKGEADEIEHPLMNQMIQELVSWFAEFTKEYGGCTCDAILEGNRNNRLERCPAVIAAIFEKCMELLERNEVL